MTYPPMKKLIEIGKVILLIAAPLIWVMLSSGLTAVFGKEVTTFGMSPDFLKFSFWGLIIIAITGLMLLFSVHRVKAGTASEKIGLTVLYLVYLLGIPLLLLEISIFWK